LAACAIHITGIDLIHRRWWRILAYQSNMVNFGRWKPAVDAVEYQQMNAVIRQAMKADLAEIKSCAIAAYTMYVERIGKNPAPMVANFSEAVENKNLYVMDSAGQVCGFVVFYPQGDHVHLENVAVNPDFQQRGIGSRLIEFAEQQAGVEGYSRIELYTNAMMTENLQIYPRLGYEEFDRRLEEGFDRVYFRKSL
jgi:ribosomal protein S18 acetylase RimI-like enzyme